MTFERELKIAIDIVKRAGELAMRYFNQTTPTEEKQDASPVTIADRECEKMIRSSLIHNFPKDGILGEEGSQVDGQSGRRWLIDPIDGTRDFVRRNSFWSVQLALQVEERVELGIIYCPGMNEMLYAVSGQGCYWNESRVRASDIARLDKSILMISGFNAVWNSWPPDAVRELTQKCWTVRCYGGCYDVIMLARGKTDIWLSGRGMEWDYAPVQVIARECAARFLTRDGDDRINKRNCVVFAGGLEQEIRSVLQIPGSR